MWFKKKEYISGYKSNTAVDGTDWRTTRKSQSWTLLQFPPSAADANKYFFLPALGWYILGQLTSVGGEGNYWSSSATPWTSDSAYYLDFNSGWVSVLDNGRNLGFRVGGFE